MRYEDDDRYLDHEEDNDLWDDELELSTDPIPPAQDYVQDQTFTPREYDEHHESTDSTHHDEEGEDYYSDPEPDPEPEQKPRSEGFFRKKVKDEDDNDFFDSDDEPAPVKKTKIPKLDPEDPDYWIEEESPLSTIKHKPRKTYKIWLAASV